MSQEGVTRQKVVCEGVVYDAQYGRWTQVVNFQGAPYDPHEGATDHGTCVYRSIAVGNNRYDAPHPDYIEVDQGGTVIKSWNLRNKKE